jgi:hypothetical protein
MPKYIIKRAIPADAVKIVGKEIEIKLINVFSPLTIDEIPDNYLDYIGVSIDGEAQDLTKGFALKAEGKTFSHKNIKEALGMTLPVGGILQITFPNLKNLAKGSTHNFDVKYTDTHIPFDRQIC